MTMEDAWRPVDELVETSVDTLIYGVETGGGLFSDTKVGRRAMSQTLPFESSYYWRAWYNMQSLIDRGLDPLQVLIDRAHQRQLDFIVSRRMGGAPGTLAMSSHFRTGRRRRRPPGKQHGFRPPVGQGHAVLLDGGTGKLPGRRHRVRLRLHPYYFKPSESNFTRP